MITLYVLFVTFDRRFGVVGNRFDVAVVVFLFFDVCVVVCFFIIIKFKATSPTICTIEKL